MKIYYIEDKNGEIYSEDKSRCFKVLHGKEAYEYLQTPEGKKKRFFNASSEETSNEIFIEIPIEKQKKFRHDENKEQYIKKIKKKYPLVIVSLEANIEDEYFFEETIADPDIDIERDFIKTSESKNLIKALSCLNEREREIIYSLYLVNDNITEQELSSFIGVPQKTINNHKRAILKKLKNVLSFHG